MSNVPPVVVMRAVVKTFEEGRVRALDEVDLDNWGLGGDPILDAREKNKKK